MMRRLLQEPRFHGAAQALGYFFGGFFLSAASLGNHPQSFALGFLCSLSGWPAVLLAAGGMTGYLTFWGAAGTVGVLWLCAGLVAAVILGGRPFLLQMPLLMSAVSAAIAAGVAAKGYRVLYETSQKLFDTYESARFGRDNAPDTEKYESCDLLLIDDLGAECGSQYTAATFFNLLNTRLMENKPTLINTNLNRAQLEKNYGERVLSRLLGEFRVLLFAGKDVRLQKLSER
jgi:hypothetical protein